MDAQYGTIIAIVLVMLLLLTIYYGRVNVKLNNKKEMISIKSVVLRIKISLIILFIISNVSIILLTILITQYNYSLLIMAVTNILIWTIIIAMVVKEHRSLGYTSKEFRAFLYQYQFVYSSLLFLSYQSQFQYLIYLQYPLLITIAYYFNTQVNDYRTNDIQSHYFKLIDAHLASSKTFQRNKQQKNHIINQSTSTNQQQDEQDDPHQSPQFNTINSQLLSQQSNHEDSLYSNFTILSCTNDGYITIGYNKENHSKKSQRSFIEIITFLKTIQKKFKSQHIEDLISQVEDCECPQSCMGTILQQLSQKEEFKKEFGIYLEFQHSYMWTKQFNSLFRTSFAICSSAKQEEQLEYASLETGTIVIKSIEYYPKMQLIYVIKTYDGVSLQGCKSLYEIHLQQQLNKLKLQLEQGIQKQMTMDKSFYHLLIQ